MKSLISSFAIICLTSFVLSAQNSPVLLTIDDREITKSEFEYIYQKNNTNVYSDEDRKSPESYLDLFIDFKLKVIEAENLKMDTSKAFINELAGYRKEVAAPYLTNSTYDEQLVHTMYERMKKEVDASHILLRVDENATPEQEKEILASIKNIREEIINGKDFEEAAAEYSEDPSAKENKGQLGYFSAFMMVYPFENAAFETQVGEISEPIRSRFGYHIIKVNDKRDNQGEILVAHIMKTFPQDASAETKQRLKQEIDSLYKLVLEGVDFAELAKKESDDRRTATDGGKMPWFAAGRIIPEFSEPAFALKNNGDVSEPIETTFGYHIIKKIDERPIASFDELRAEIERRIKRDPERNNSSKHIFIDQLKEEYNYQTNNKGVEMLNGLNIQKDSLPDLSLFIIDGKTFSANDFHNWILKNKIEGGSYSSTLDKWIDAEILAYEDSKLEEKHPDFKYLMQEYHDGILLFSISQDKIWNFASRDTVGLENFYEKNQNNHMWEEHFRGSIITCINQEVHEMADELFAGGLNNEDVLAHINNEEDLIEIETGVWENGDSPIVDFYVWNGPEPEGFNSETTFVRGDKIDPQPKTLDEARGLFISDYQQYLEQKWIKELRSKYKVKINKKVLKTVDGV